MAGNEGLTERGSTSARRGKLSYSYKILDSPSDTARLAPERRSAVNDQNNNTFRKQGVRAS